MSKATWDTYEEWLDVRIIEAREKVDKIEAILYTEGGSAKQRDEWKNRLAAYESARAYQNAQTATPTVPDTAEAEETIARAVFKTEARRGVYANVCTEAADAARLAYRQIARAKP